MVSDFLIFAKLRGVEDCLLIMREKEFLPLLQEKLGIEELNPMQRKMLDASSEKRDIILLSPTGSGKTVAFALPVLKQLKSPTGRVQAVVIAPSRELVIQIAGVLRALAKGFKVVLLYGGHNVEDEVNSLQITPDIIVATPGRLLDHIRRRNLDALPVRIVVLDEFDKSLELGFEEDMSKIIAKMKNVSRYYLTSATRADIIPEFLRLDNPLEVDFLDSTANVRNRMSVKRVLSEKADKLEALLDLLRSITKDGNPTRSIIFVNHRESAERVYDYLRKNNVDCVLYHGALEQMDRESAIALFNNGSRPILVATDLAARGLDIEGVENIVHYHQPLTAETYTHRNGRTARVQSSGDIYLLVGPEEQLKEFVTVDEEFSPVVKNDASLRSGLVTLYISAGKKEKLSKGDIVGYLTKECGLASSEIGKIDVYDHYSLVAVTSSKAPGVVKKSKETKIKGSKRKVDIKRG